MKVFGEVCPECGGPMQIQRGEKNTLGALSWTCRLCGKTVMHHPKDRVFMPWVNGHPPASIYCPQCGQRHHQLYATECGDYRLYYCENCDRLNGWHSR